MRILLIEDDEALGSSTCAGLKQYGYTVDWLKSAQMALSFIRKETFDVIVLDLNLPGKPGLTLLKELRKHKVEVPVLIWTAFDTIEVRIEGLNRGGDDCVAKTTDLRELSARIQALQRRSKGGRAQPNLVYRNIILDPSALTVHVSGKLVHTSRHEFVLFHKLLENKGRVISRDIIMQSLYGWGGDIDSNTLEVYVCNLRKKLGFDAIKTIRGVGYMIMPDVEEGKEKEGDKIVERGLKRNN